MSLPVRAARWWILCRLSATYQLITLRTPQLTRFFLRPLRQYTVSVVDRECISGCLITWFRSYGRHHRLWLECCNATMQQTYRRRTCSSSVIVVISFVMFFQRHFSHWTHHSIAIQHSAPRVSLMLNSINCLYWEYRQKKVIFKL